MAVRGTKRVLRSSVIVLTSTVLGVVTTMSSGVSLGVSLNSDMEVVSLLSSSAQNRRGSLEANVVMRIVYRESRRYMCGLS